MGVDKHPVVVLRQVFAVANQATCTAIAEAAAPPQRSNGRTVVLRQDHEVAEVECWRARGDRYTIHGNTHAYLYIAVEVIDIDARRRWHLIVRLDAWTLRRLVLHPLADRVQADAVLDFGVEGLLQQWQ